MFQRVPSRPTLAAGVAVLVTLAAAAQAGAATTFTDDFNRPDGPIGNGWTMVPVPPGSAGYFIQNDVVTTNAPSSSVVLYRPVDFSGGVTVTATITDTSGFGGVSNRFQDQISFGDNGGDDKLAVAIIRGDNNFADSNVQLIVNGSEVSQFTTPFQFNGSFTTTLQLAADGSIDGSVSSNGGTFDFSFGSQGPIPTGGALAFLIGGADDRSQSFIFPTLDNVSITTFAVPEPGAWGLLVLGFAGLGVELRRRRHVRDHRAA